MGKSSSYESKVPDEQGLIHYSETENAVWRDLMTRQAKVLPGRVCNTYIKGLEILDLPGDRVPQLRDVDRRLGEVTGFGVAAVPALITPKRFFALLAERKFPAATFIRRREEFDYLQEPDIFHEIYGHCPLLTHQVYTDFLQRYAQMALAAGSKYYWMMQRLFWFTVEFGLIRNDEGLRIYGAGIASSAGESPYALESDVPEHRPFDPVMIFRTPYRIDIYQTVYYVIDDIQQLFDLVSRDLVPLMNKAQELGPLPPTFPPKEAAAIA